MEQSPSVKASSCSPTPEFPHITAEHAVTLQHSQQHVLERKLFYVCEQTLLQMRLFVYSLGHLCTIEYSRPTIAKTLISFLLLVSLLYQHLLFLILPAKMKHQNK